MDANMMSQMMSAIVAIIVGLVTVAAMVIGALFWLFNVHFSTKRNTELIKVLFNNQEKNELKIETKLEENRKTTQDLSSKVSICLDRFEHMTKELIRGGKH